LRRGLVVGRFQPFHKGHLYLINSVMKECHELIIVVGSAQFNYLYTDPFTAGERILMIHTALLESRIPAERVYIIPVFNDENNSTWYARLSTLIPEFHVLYSGNEFVKCLVGTRVPIQTPIFAKKRTYNGTNIRNLIAREKPWIHLVPSSVALLMEKVDGIRRIQALSKVENPVKPKTYPNIK
jgi:nicotinamide-nucleotide adenylyltransferase